MSNGEGFQRRRQQHSRADLGLDLEVVGDHEIIHHGLQDLVDLTFGREQSDLLQALDRVILSLTLPQPLTLDRNCVLCRIALIMHLRGIYQNLCKFFVAAEMLQIITPQTCLRFEAQAVRHSIMQIGFFAVNVGRQPEARPQIQSPTIKVQIITVMRSRAIGSVEADNIVMLVFYPNSPNETAAGMLFRLDVDYQATDLSQEFSSDKVKVVVLALKVVVHDH